MPFYDDDPMDHVPLKQNPHRSNHHLFEPQTRHVRAPSQPQLDTLMAMGIDIVPDDHRHAAIMIQEERRRMQRKRKKNLRDARRGI